MPHEADVGREGVELRLNGGIRLQADPRLGAFRRRVDKGGPVRRRLQGEGREPGELVVVEESPVESGSGLPVPRKYLDVFLMGDRRVVVAENRDLAGLPDQVDARAGVRSVPDHVAKAHHCIHPPALDIGEGGGECGQVRVDI